MPVLINKTSRRNLKAFKGLFVIRQFSFQLLRLLWKSKCNRVVPISGKASLARSLDGSPIEVLITIITVLDGDTFAKDDFVQGAP